MEFINKHNINKESNPQSNSKNFSINSNVNSMNLSTMNLRGYSNDSKISPKYIICNK